MCIRDRGTGHGKALALPAGQVGAALVERRCKAALEMCIRDRNRPKYSPDFSGGMILAKWLRLSAWMPPWNMPTTTAKMCIRDRQYHPAKAPCRETGGAFLRYGMGVMKNISKILHKSRCV